jgi:hypothetical protein
MNVGGSLIIENCPNLVDLRQLENLTTVWGDFSVSACNNLVSTGPNDFKLQRTNSITFQNNPSLSFITAFPDLTDCDFFNLLSNGNLSSYSGVNSLEATANIWISNNAILSSVNGFLSVNSLNVLTITSNPVLTDCCFAARLIAISNIDDISGNALQCNSASAIDAPPQFIFCPEDATVSTDFGNCTNQYPARLPIGSDNCDFESATIKITLGDGTIWFDGVYGSPGSTFNYPVNPGINTFDFVFSDANGNTSECNAVITVEDDQAPVDLGNLPGQINVNTGSNCTGTFTATAEGFEDNCAIDYYAINISQGTNSIYQENLVPGVTKDYDLDPGNYVYVIRAFDVNGLSTSDFANLTVIDNTPPEWTGSNLSQSVEVECGEATVEETLQANIPSATDCSEVSIEIEDINPLTTDCGLQIVEYEFVARDASGNINMDAYRLTITEVDTKKPTLSGVPSDLTIGCNDPFPAFPNLVATDNCDGDISSSISFTEIPGMGVCGLNQVAQTFSRTASVTDNCGNNTTAKWNVTIVSDFTFTLGDDIVTCEGGNQSYTLDPQITGASYAWSTGATSQTIIVNESGSYELTITTSNGCCFTDEVEVIVGSLPDVSATGGTLSCDSGSIQLMGTSTISGVSYSWSGPQGFSSSSPDPTVSIPGTYTLLVRNAQGCENSTQVTVESDQNVPDASATGGSITCANPTTQIQASSTTSGVNYSWSGPGDFASTEQSPVVTEPGIYTVTVTGSNGCLSTATAEVIGNTDIPLVSLMADTINCNKTEVRITLQSDIVLLETTWSGPGDFLSNETTPFVDQAGTYEVLVRSVNGCEISYSIDIIEDLDIPDISTNGGTISCTENSVEINASSSTIGAQFRWTGPDNFTSNEANPEVSQPGSYLVTVIGQNGCTALDSAMVEAETDLPEISAQGGTIDGVNEAVTLIGTTSSADATISWSGPNGFMSSTSENTVDIPGQYTFTVISTSGCTSFKNVEVVLDNSDPDLILSEGITDCDSGTRQFDAFTTAENPTFQWEGPDGFTSSENFPSYSKAGMYSVTVTGGNGCQTTGSYTVEQDITLIVEVSTMGTSAMVEVLSGAGPFFYFWDGVFGSESIDNLSEGEHFVSVIDNLGCSEEIFFTINTSSVDEITEFGKISISPNPTNDLLRVTLENKVSSNLKYNIHSIDGALVQSGTIDRNDNLLEVTDFQNGVYFLQIYHEGRYMTYKFIKM